MSGSPQAAVLVLRIWLEDGDPSVIRARIVQTGNVNVSGTPGAVAGDVDDICDVVRAWAEHFARSSES